MIRVQGLCRSFAGVPALRDVTFSVGRGEVAGLLGPNGAGKTTCLRILANLMVQDAGRVEVGGRPLPEHGLQVRGGLGYVAEGVQQATMVGPVAGVLGATALILFSMDVRRCRKWIDSEYEFVDAPRSAESPGRDLLVAPVFAVTPEGGTLGSVGLW